MILWRFSSQVLFYFNISYFCFMFKENNIPLYILYTVENQNVIIRQA